MANSEFVRGLAIALIVIVCVAYKVYSDNQEDAQIKLQRNSWKDPAHWDKQSCQVVDVGVWGANVCGDPFGLKSEHHLPKGVNALGSWVMSQSTGDCLEDSTQQCNQGVLRDFSHPAKISNLRAQEVQVTNSSIMLMSHLNGRCVNSRLIHGKQFMPWVLVQLANGDKRCAYQAGLPHQVSSFRVTATQEEAKSVIDQARTAKKRGEEIPCFVYLPGGDDCAVALSKPSGWESKPTQSLQLGAPIASHPG
eukprot:gnl/MRDRNA2_/MRDRNA2_75772_c0_seq1.p1 gnl/MRDRNA2_/MRDRNA2_75772_c0~~gnl/MRDRNA2_/MRDRNA2_75772_c0_seq1.p1  ORF type:complete len:280 (+),score=30.97 gnl/MRDRNA2_/MRDRNA2_75772_c0_seq1:92-841(+)